MIFLQRLLIPQSYTQNAPDLIGCVIHYPGCYSNHNLISDIMYSAAGLIKLFYCFHVIPDCIKLCTYSFLHLPPFPATHSYRQNKMRKNTPTLRLILPYRSPGLQAKGHSAFSVALSAFSVAPSTFSANECGCFRSK